MSLLGPDLSFDVSMVDECWLDIRPALDDLAARLRAILPPDCLPAGPQEVSLVLTDDTGIRQLNYDYRGKDAPTNVLSFPTIEAPGLLGDIILARETIMREAADKRVSFEHHFTHLIIHGLLHLLGHDHQSSAQAAKMEAIEISALEKLGIANPYILKA